MVTSTFKPVLFPLFHFFDVFSMLVALSLLSKEDTGLTSNAVIWPPPPPLSRWALTSGGTS